MKIYVFNKKNRIAADFILYSAVILIVTLSISLGVVLKGMGKSLFIEAANPDESKIVILDAGHGGEDPGAIGAGNIYEKDLNLSIAFAIGEELERSGYVVVYTRTEDKLLYSEHEDIYGMRKIYDLKNRCKVAGAYPEALFISIHMNSYGSEKYSGLQVYYSDGNDDSLLLARSIQTAVKEKLQPENKRSVKNGKDLYLLKNMQNTAVLVECGFLTNPEECEKLSEKEYQKQLSFSVVYGIINYIEDKNDHRS